MIKYPENVIKIMDIFKSSGYVAYAVGGCVRDSIMGKVPNDWDVTTSCRPEKMLEIFSSQNIKTIPTGIKHGTVSVLLDGEIYECTTFRIDGEYTDSRHPDSVEFTDELTLDLSRRDFTVNAMAANPALGICDPFGGMSDLEKKIIRCVGKPEKRFAEDALRILRALRFATTLGFKIEENTLSAIKKLSHTLNGISSERKTAEFSKILCCDNPLYGLELLFESGVIKYIIPDAEPFLPEIRDGCSDLKPFRTEIRDGCSDLKRFPPEIRDVRADFSLRFAALLWRTNCRDLSCLCLSNKEKKNISLALEKIPFEPNAEGARRALAKYGEICRDVCIIQGRNDLAELLLEKDILSSAVRISQLDIDGNRLKELGFSPRKIGEILAFLLDCVIKNPECNTRKSLEKIAYDNFSA